MADPTIALALGAGGARGIAHIHALEVLDELGLKPVAMAGTSIGAVMGSGYCAGMTGSEIHEYVLKKFGERFKLIGELRHLWPDTFKGFMEDGGFRIGEINIHPIVQGFLPEQVPENFEDLQIPMQIVATDFYAGTDKIFSSGPLRQAIGASAAMPAVFLPVTIDETVYIDGGTTNPVPFDLLAGKADIIIGVDVAGGQGGTPGKRPSKLAVVTAAPQMMQRAIVRDKAKHAQIDILIEAPVEEFGALDFLRTKSLIEAASPMRDELKRALDKVFQTAMVGQPVAEDSI